MDYIILYENIDLLNSECQLWYKNIIYIKLVFISTILFLPKIIDTINLLVLFMQIDIYININIMYNDKFYKNKYIYIVLKMDQI